MRKIILTFILIMISFIVTSTSNAGCVTNQDTFMYFDAVRFFKVARVCATNQQQCIIMMMDDVERGDAVYLPGGTQLDAVEKVPDNPKVCVVRKGNILLMGLTQAINCR
jgi:hypothetical protein